MNMKTVKNILGIVLASVAFAGCSDFLSTRADSDMTHDSYYNSVTELEGGLNAAYSRLSVGHNLGTYAKGINILGEMGTDEAFTEGKQELNALPLDRYSSLNSTNTILSKFYTQAYDAINKGNEILDAAPKLAGTDVRVDGIVGEAEFLNALWYFNLVRNFGAVPLKKTASVSSDDFASMKRNSVEEVYKYIIELLQDAGEKLGDTEYAGKIGRADRYAAYGLLAKVYLNAASSMLLLQPKLTEDMKLGGLNSFEWTDVDDNGVELSAEETMKYYYRKAADYAMMTIDYYGGETCLEAGNLVGCFYPVESTRDVLFEAVFSQNLTPNQGNYFGFLFGPKGSLAGGGGHNVIASLSCIVVPNFTCSYDKSSKVWSSSDRRFMWSIATYKYDQKTNEKIVLDGNKTGGICRDLTINKFHTNLDDLPPHSIGVGVNNPILRLSDVCLIYAEAMGELSWMESGSISNEAFKYLNVVRRNAGVMEYTLEEVCHAEPIKLHQAFNSIPRANKEMKGYVTSTEIEHWRRTIMNERMLELLGEGHRWYDLVRMGLLKDVAAVSGDFAGHGNPPVYLNRAVEDFHVFRPIPLREMQLHQNTFVQNFGYY